MNDVQELLSLRSATTIAEILKEDEEEFAERERRDQAEHDAAMSRDPSGQPWAAFLPRLRLVDKGHSQTFGLRWKAKLEGFEVACSRQQYRSLDSGKGVPLLHYAAALLHAAGADPASETWRIRLLMEENGVGPPYSVTRPNFRDTLEKAEKLLEGY